MVAVLLVGWEEEGACWRRSSIVAKCGREDDPAGGLDFPGMSGQEMAVEAELELNRDDSEACLLATVQIHQSCGELL